MKIFSTKLTSDRNGCRDAMYYSSFLLNLEDRGPSLISESGLLLAPKIINIDCLGVSPKRKTQKDYKLAIKCLTFL